MNDYQISFDSDLVDAFLFRLDDDDRIIVERTLLRFLNTGGADQSLTSVKIGGSFSLLGVPVLTSDRYLRVWWVDRYPIAHILHLAIVETEPSDDWFDDI